MSGLKYHGGMKGLYAMLALTEASLVDDDVDTTPVRTKKRQDHEDEGQVTIHMRTRLGGGVRIWPRTITAPFTLNNRAVVGREIMTKHNPPTNSVHARDLGYPEIRCYEAPNPSKTVRNSI